jgi:gliding motility-associated-like protein
VVGVLTIEAVDVDIIIPNTFSPNWDSSNGRWLIKNLEKYSNNTVEIHNRYGERVYSSIGYSIPWDGKYKVNELPPATYYYIINTKNGRKLISGPVTIIR